MIKILSVFVFLSLNLFAQESLQIQVGFSEFLNKALQNSPYLKALDLDIKKASLEGEILTRYKNPSLALEYANFKSDSGGDEDGYRVALSQELRLWGVGADKDKASLSMQKKSQALYLISRAQLLKDISSSFAQYSQEKDLYILREEELFIAKRIYNISEERYKVGTISRGKMLQAKVDYEMVAIALEMKKLSYKERYFSLLELAGYFYEVDLNHKYTFKIEQSIASNPNLILLEKEKKYVSDRAKVDTNKVQAVDLVLEYENEPEDDIFRIGFEIPLAIFDNKSQEMKISKLEARKLDYSIQKHSSKIAFKVLEFKQKRDLLKSLKAKNETTLQTQKKLLVMFEDAYKIANTKLLELQSVKNQLIQTKRNLIQNKFALDINAINTNYISGAYNE